MHWAITRFILCSGAFAVTVQANAQQCERTRLTGYSLIMAVPRVGPTEIPVREGPVERGTVLASRVIEIAPELSWLADDVTFRSESAEEFARDVPLGAGSLVTSWTGSDNRRCSIGWRNGLFGGAMGDGHMRWVCFLDRDGDGRFDHAFRPETRNMGLSFSTRTEELAQQVALTIDSPDGPSIAYDDRFGGLGSHQLVQQLIVRRVGRSDLRIRLEGPGRGSREEIDLASEAGSSATIGGFEVEVVSVNNRDVQLSVRGEFADLSIVPLCEGGSYSIDGSIAAVQFTFPDW